MLAILQDALNLVLSKLVEEEEPQFLINEASFQHSLAVEIYNRKNDIADFRKIGLEYPSEINEDVNGKIDIIIQRNKLHAIELKFFKRRVGESQAFYTLKDIWRLIQLKNNNDFSTGYFICVFDIRYLSRINNNPARSSFCNNNKLFIENRSYSFENSDINFTNEFTREWSRYLETSYYYILTEIN